MSSSSLTIRVSFPNVDGGARVFDAMVDSGADRMLVSRSVLEHCRTASPRGIRSPAVPRWDRPAAPRIVNSATSAVAALQIRTASNQRIRLDTAIDGLVLSVQGGGGGGIVVPVAWPVPVLDNLVPDVILGRDILAELNATITFRPDGIEIVRVCPPQGGPCQQHVRAAPPKQ